MSLLARILFREPAPRAPIIRIAPRPTRVVELEDEGSFATAIQQAEAVRRNAPGHGQRQQLVEVVIAVSDDQKNWRDAETFWRGAWRPSWEGGVPLPTKSDLVEVGRQTGARFARSQVRSTI
jgi:hypothetical protein